MTSPTARAPRKSKPRLSQPILTAAQQTTLTPLAYMLLVIRDPAIDAARRDRLAIAAAPYCHQRLAEKTKKAADAEAAEKAGDAHGWAGDLEWEGHRQQ